MTNKLMDTWAPPLLSDFLQTAEVLKLVRTKHPLRKCYSAHLANSTSLGFALLSLGFWVSPSHSVIAEKEAGGTALGRLALHLQVISLAEMVAFNS